MAGGWELLQLLQAEDGTIDWAMLALGTAVAAAAGYLCIHWLLAVINRIGLAPFAIYRFAVAALILVVFL
jgi:undecaprenyl-diphosphatase